MSRYLIDQIATRAEHRDALPHRGRRRPTARTSLEAIDVRDRATGETTRARVGRPLHLHRRRRRDGWLPAEIALDRHGYVLTGADVRAPARWTLDRDP